MNRKEYELIAKVFATQLRVASRNYYENIAVNRLLQYLEIELGNAYPNFDRERFLEACGVVR